MATKRKILKETYQSIDSVCSDVLQALLYWIGYKKASYPFYHFSEGALTAELYTLFQSKLNNNYYLRPEFPYKKIPAVTSDIENNKKRVDILIFNPKKGRVLEEDSDGDFIIKQTDEIFLFEVKKFESTNDISNDFEKLYQCKLKNNNIRGFVIFINQKTLPPIGKNVKVGESEKQLKNWEKRIEQFVNKHSNDFKTKIIAQKVLSADKRGVTSNSKFGVLVEVLI